MDDDTFVDTVCIVNGLGECIKHIDCEGRTVDDSFEVPDRGLAHEEITIKFDLTLEKDHGYSLAELAEAIIQSVAVEGGQYLPELKEFTPWVEH